MQHRKQKAKQSRSTAQALWLHERKPPIGANKVTLVGRRGLCRHPGLPKALLAVHGTDHHPRLSVVAGQTAAWGQECRAQRLCSAPMLTALSVGRGKAVRWSRQTRGREAAGGRKAGVAGNTWRQYLVSMRHQTWA